MQGSLELLTVYDVVNHAVFQKELGSLKAVGQLLTNRVRNDTGAREADEGPRLCDVDVAEERKARGHPAGPAR